MSTRPSTPSIHTVAQESLEQTAHGLFHPTNYRIMDRIGREVTKEWFGVEINHATVHPPTTVTKAWRVLFWPQKWTTTLPPELTRDEAERVAENVRMLVNTSRVGGP